MNTIPLTLSPFESVTSAAERAVADARLYFAVVEFTMNGVLCRAAPWDTAATIVRRYRTELERRMEVCE